LLGACCFAAALAFASLTASPIPAALHAQSADPLPSWNDGATKQAILDFVKETTDKAGTRRTPGTGLDYAAQFKLAVDDGISLGAELFGNISDLGDVPSFNDTEFRVGPVLYLSWRSDQSHVGFTGDIGVLLGTTDATPDTTIKRGPRADFLTRKIPHTNPPAE
jgi:hypothetical protein